MGSSLLILASQQSTEEVIALLSVGLLEGLLGSVIGGSPILLEVKLHEGLLEALSPCIVSNDITLTLTSMQPKILPN